MIDDGDDGKYKELEPGPLARAVKRRVKARATRSGQPLLTQQKMRTKELRYHGPPPNTGSHLCSLTTALLLGIPLFHGHSVIDTIL